MGFFLIPLINIFGNQIDQQSKGLQALNQICLSHDRMRQNKKLHHNSIIQKMSQKQKTRSPIPTFILKLLKILEDPQCQQHISWLESNDGFKIADVPEFTEAVLPKYFKHRNYCSFVRQLNMYGFAKVRRQDCRDVYQNCDFRRGSRVGLRRIQRKVNYAEEDAGRDREEKKSSSRYESQKNLEQIRERQLTLEQKFKSAITNNHKVFTKNSKALQSLNRKDKNEQQLLQGLFKIFKTDLKPDSNPNLSRAETSRTFSGDQEYKHESTMNESQSYNRSSLYVELEEFEEMDDMIRQF